MCNYAILERTSAHHKMCEHILCICVFGNPPLSYSHSMKRTILSQYVSEVEDATKLLSICEELSLVSMGRDNVGDIETSYGEWNLMLRPFYLSRRILHILWYQKWVHM